MGNVAQYFISRKNNWRYFYRKFFAVEVVDMIKNKSQFIEYFMKHDYIDE